MPDGLIVLLVIAVVVMTPGYLASVYMVMRHVDKRHAAFHYDFWVTELALELVTAPSWLLYKAIRGELKDMISVLPYD